MADEQQNQDTEDTGGKKPGRRLPLWIVGIVSIELIAALAVVKILVPSQESEDPEAWRLAAEVIERDIPSVVVNLRDGNAKRLLRVHVTLHILAEKPSEAKAAVDRPGVIEDRLVNLLGQKRLSDVSGRQAEVKLEIQEMLGREVFTAEWRGKHGEVEIEEILMPEFVIQ